MRRRSRVLVGLSVAAFAGLALVGGTTAWFLRDTSVDGEEEAVADLARNLGQRTERILTEARTLLDTLNQHPAQPCSDAHLQAMDGAAVGHPWIVSVGYWRGANRQCSAGFTEAVELKPPQADRIYDSGVIAWWPSSHTEVAGVQLFLMRYGRHDVAIDPRLLLNATPARGRELGLWVEGIRMASQPPAADLPAPTSLAQGTTLNSEDDTLVSRFSLGTLFPVDVVVTEPLGKFWARHWVGLSVATLVALIVAALWLYGVVKYSRRRLSLVTELREALAQGHIRARYQPIVDLRTGLCVGAEALARWTRDTGEEMSPSVFIPVSERAGLIREVTRALLDTTLQDLGPTLRNTPGLAINLNLANADLEGSDFSRHLAKSLESAGVTPASLNLEITERSLVDVSRARPCIDRLRDCGYRIAIDDFGTGYSSLACLESFNLDTLKFDKSFLEAVESGVVTHHVLDHMIGMAKSMGLTTVAEGVETRAQAEWLYRQGVDRAQGFLFSGPLSARRLRAFLRAQRGSNVHPFPSAHREAASG
jgi:sensor c-di-GMP phosphodiesterase-like protein